MFARSVPTIAWFFLSMSTALAQPPAPGEVPANARHRQAVVNALGYLRGDGAKLEKNASCINCHHAPLRGWALREAARIGVEVDADALQDDTTVTLQKLRKLKDNYRNQQWGHSLSSFFVLGGV